MLYTKVFKKEEANTKNVGLKEKKNGGNKQWSLLL